MHTYVHVVENNTYACTYTHIYIMHMFIHADTGGLIQVVVRVCSGVAKVGHTGAQALPT